MKITSTVRTMAVTNKEHNFTTPQDHGQVIRFVTMVGLFCNIALSAVKFAAGILGHSQAVVADAVHSLSDTISDLAIIIGSFYWSKPADHDHPYGHRRIETLVTLFVGAMLLLAGVGIIRQAVISLQGDASTSNRPGVVALIATVISIVSKEIMYQWTKREGERVKSSAMVANAWHHRTDALSSIPALLAVAGSIVFPSWWFLDGIGAVVVSLFIMHVAYGILRPGLMELVDSSASPDVLKQIKLIAEDSEGVLQIHKLRSRLNGALLHIDLHVVVDGSISVRQGHDIAEDVQMKIMQANLDVVDVVVHIEPAEQVK